ncbi:MAG TPA: YidC/Oxa1 family membrane protein insertase [Candidatus Paceibacterota bacterium]|nr:YidC/Oxa1 family membrane protein insertase [Candidatus Paceibacterota bacterium]
MLAAIGSAFSAIIYRPLYNGLVFLVGALPAHDVGVAVVVLTLFVRFVLFPLSRRAVQAQLAMKRIAPEVEKLKEKYKTKPEEQGRAIFALYKERGVHPFAGFALILIQLPILFGLYWVFARGGLPVINLSLLYPFVHAPTTVNMEFLGLIDMKSRSIPLAILAALSQFIYTRLSMGPSEKSSPVEASLSGDMAKSFEVQARYILPAIVGVIGFSLASAAPLYWTTSNTFMILQEYLSGRRFNDPGAK